MSALIQFDTAAAQSYGAYVAVPSEEPSVSSKPEDTNTAAGSQISLSQSRVIGTVRSPLGFFTLALLIVESFLLGAGAGFNLGEDSRRVLIWVGIALFLIVFFSVYLLVVKWPQNLVFTEESHIRFAAMQVYGESKAPVTGYELVLKNISAALPAPGTQPPAIATGGESASPEEPK